MPLTETVAGFVFGNDNDDDDDGNMKGYQRLLGYTKSRA